MSKRNSGSNDGIQGNDAPKLERNVSRPLQRGYSASGYSKMRGQDRLSGGADAKSKSAMSISKDELEGNSRVQILTPAMSANIASEAEREIEAILAKSEDDGSTGDKKVDEMIDYVIQNIQEAGKALASLGENFEHNLKLMFADVMEKVQNWVSVAQVRLENANKDLNNLRKELVSRSNDVAARDKEIEEVKKQLAESQAAFDIALAEQNTQKSVVAVQLPSPSTMSFIPSRQPLSGVEVSSASSDLKAATSEATAAAASDSRHVGVESSVHFPETDVITTAHSSHSVPTETISEHPVAALSDETWDATIQHDQQYAPDAQSLTKSQHSGPLQQRASQSQSSSQNQLSRSSQQKATQSQSSSQNQLSRLSEQKASQSQSSSQNKLNRSSQQRAAEAQSSSHNKLDRSSQQRAVNVRTIADVAVQSGKGKRERKRESELESEVVRLRKENQRILKERADYENAIQRALLRGVSSLNAETLKVLRCTPPIACYTPCGPPPSPVNTVETMIPCLSTKTRLNGTLSGCKTAPAVNSRRGDSKMHVDETFNTEEYVCCGAVKESATSARETSSRHRKSSGSSARSMAFVFQQSASPIACFPPPCIVPPTRTCGRAKSKKLEASICTRKFH